MLTNYYDYSGLVNLYAVQSDGWKSINLRSMFIFSNTFVSAHQTIYSTNSTSQEWQDNLKITKKTTKQNQIGFKVNVQ